MCPDSDIAWNQSLYCTSLQIIYTGYWSWFLIMTFHTWQSFPLSHIQNGRGPRLYTLVLYEIGNRWNAWLFPPPASVWMSKATGFFVPASLWPAATRQSCIFQLLKQRFPVSSENLSKKKTIIRCWEDSTGHPLSSHWPWSIRISKIQTWWTSSPPLAGVTCSRSYSQLMSSNPSSRLKQWAPHYFGHFSTKDNWTCPQDWGLVECQLAGRYKWCHS